VDVGYDERVNADGSLGLFWREQNNNTAERYVLPGGRVRVEGYHERGGRYVQLTARRATGAVTIHSVQLRRTVGDYPIKASFECGDAVMNWAWRVGVETTQASMSDGWIDPWRERGLYIGDALVEAEATRSFTDDDRMSRWSLKLWARTQKPDGQMLDVTPGWKTAPLVDYTLIWILMLHDHVAWGGDLDLVREVYACIDRIFASPVYERGASGLWIPRDKAFIDWGVVPEQRVGENGPLNAFRYEALRCAARLAGAIGKADDADRWTREAEGVRAAFQSLWDESSGRYANARVNGELSNAPGVHCNVLALLYDLVPADRIERVAKFVVGEARQNMDRRSGKMAVYFLHYAMEALYRLGLAGEAERVLRTHYGFQKDQGVLTLVEEIDRLRDGVGSFCHGWACGNLVVCRKQVLGVDWDFGRLDRVRVRPQGEVLDWAEGEVPHPRGTIRVSWRVQEGVLFVTCETPAGVAAQVEPRGRLGRLRLAATVRQREVTP
jgi:hypothetical protein